MNYTNDSVTAHCTNYSMRKRREHGFYIDYKAQPQCWQCEDVRQPVLPVIDDSKDCHDHRKDQKRYQQDVCC